MAYSLVSATDFTDLLNEIELFAEAQGWTVDWNTGSQIGLHSGNCYAAWGLDGTTNPVVVTDTYPTPDVNYNDFRFRGALGKNFAGHASHYWGLTGSPVTAATDVDRVSVNDLMFPVSEVHFFGDSTYIWIVVKSTEDRYTNFGFGVFDKRGQTTPDVAFMGGQYWHWWENGTSGGDVIKTNMGYHSSDPGNDMFWVKEGAAGNYYVPDGVLDPAYGIADDVVVARNDNFQSLTFFSVSTQWDDGKLLSHYGRANNKPVTGGVPLLSMPFLFTDNTLTGLTCYIGDWPGVRLCDVSNLAIGEEITYGSETWMAFPVKRRTSGAYDGGASSYGFGIAFKKD